VLFRSSTILREGITVAHENDNLEDIKRKMLLRRNEFMPIISSTNEILDVILWETLFTEESPKTKVQLNLPQKQTTQPIKRWLTRR
jgi:hypothetical protein